MSPNSSTVSSRSTSGRSPLASWASLFSVPVGVLRCTSRIVHDGRRNAGEVAGQEPIGATSRTPRPLCSTVSRTRHRFTMEVRWDRSARHHELGDGRLATGTPPVASARQPSTARPTPRPSWPRWRPTWPAVSGDPALGRITFGAWSQEYLEGAVHKRSTTLAQDRQRLRLHILPVFGRLPLAQITPLDVRRFVEQLNTAPGAEQRPHGLRHAEGDPHRRCVGRPPGREPVPRREAPGQEADRQAGPHRRRAPPPGRRLARGVPAHRLPHRRRVSALEGGRRPPRWPAQLHVADADRVDRRDTHRGRWVRGRQDAGGPAHDPDARLPRVHARPAPCPSRLTRIRRAGVRRAAGRGDAHEQLSPPDVAAGHEAGRPGGLHVMGSDTAPSRSWSRWATTPWSFRSALATPPARRRWTCTATSWRRSTRG